MTMQPWFTEAKLGIFVHYGIYSVEGVPESWALFDHVVPHEQYMRQLDRFTASAFDASAWAGLFARGGRSCCVSPAPGAEDPRAWDRYLAYRDGQVHELLSTVCGALPLAVEQSRSGPNRSGARSLMERARSDIRH
ncbi:alpha-L-fucosidase [Streptomyces tendae]|uniref:alpha-L-fucosidase n=1 Tax=Streptomyces tendae TaxID=1932 RepID=UPI00367CE901